MKRHNRTEREQEAFIAGLEASRRVCVRSIRQLKSLGWVLNSNGAAHVLTKLTDRIGRERSRR